MDSKIVSLLRKRREGLSFQKIARELHLPPREKQVLSKRLKKLQGQGIVLRLKRLYYMPAKSNLVKGKFFPHPRGYGFVSPEIGLSDDIFVHARQSGGALKGDIVEVLYREKGKRGKPEGRVIRIVKKGDKEMVGLYSERMGQAFFLPFDSPSSEEIPITCEKQVSPRPGMIVEVDRGTLKLTDVLGMPDAPGVDTRTIIKRFSLASSFSEEVLAEVRGFSSEISAEDRKQRKDYRNWLTVTIDGENARDFDDAVSVRKLENGHFLLGVHIADVSHYVQQGSSLDSEAFERGTSVYFPDLTLPMLPEELSNHICSLRPKEEKLTFSVLLEINTDGAVVKTKFYPSLIKTAERMTYKNVYKIFQGDEKERRRYSKIVPHLLMMKKLARILRKKWEKEGSLDFDLLEPELVYKEGSLHSIVPFERNEAHQLIEEFMVTANEAVASFLSLKNVPSIYRIHPPPGIEDIKALREMLCHFNIFLPSPKKVNSKDLQEALKKADGKPEEKFISIQVLRSLRIATYSEEDAGHYGLARKKYTHFTSPIRRYPDLVIHRILKRVLRQEKEKMPSLTSVALQSSQQERNAEGAERELIKWRIFRLLKEKLGEEFYGIIVDITKAGLVVELDDYFVDGIVFYSDLGRDYYFKKTEKTLVGKRTGRKFELGDRLKVVVVSVDPILRRMGLTICPAGKERI